MGVNRLSACREFFGVHSWQNGTRCRDGLNVLWCRSHLVWLVFESSIPTCACFHSENDLFLLLFFLIVFRNGERREVGKKGEGKMQSVKYVSIEPCCSQRTKKFKKLPSEIVNPNIKLLYLGGLKANSHKTQVQSTSFMRLYMQALHAGFACRLINLIDPNSVVSNQFRL